MKRLLYPVYSRNCLSISDYGLGRRLPRILRMNSDKKRSNPLTDDESISVTAHVITNSNSRTITFKSKEHEKFYMEYLEKCRYQDVYHQALVYCLGIDRDTRENVNKIYNFKTGCVKTESLQEGWQTSGSLRIVRMAFNLYCNGTPSVGDYEAEEDQLKECQYYTVEDLFCCGYARYFWEAIKIRYPEYCFYKDWEDMYAEN